MSLVAQKKSQLKQLNDKNRLVIAAATFTDLGMAIKALTPTLNFDKHELEIMANYYSVIVSQSQEARLYGPFPVPHKESWILNTLKFQIIDHSVKDERVVHNGGKVPAFLLILADESLTNEIFKARERIEYLTMQVIEKLNTTQSLTNQQLQQLSHSILSLLTPSADLQEKEFKFRDAIVLNELPIKILNERISVIKTLIKHQLIATRQILMMFFVTDEELFSLKRLLSLAINEGLVMTEMTTRDEENHLISLIDLKEVLILMTNNPDLTWKLNKIKCVLDKDSKDFSSTLLNLNPNGIYFSANYLLNLFSEEEQLKNIMSWMNKNKQINIVIFDPKERHLLSASQFSQLLKLVTEQSIDVLIPVKRGQDDFIDVLNRILERIARKMTQTRFN